MNLGLRFLFFCQLFGTRGNITSETRNGNTTTYEYDALGQLVRVNDKNDTTGGSTGTTWIYAYDRGGNILSKTAYAFTAEEVGTAVRTYTYGYTDTNWKDKLTSFDNNTITYDGIGNPLNDGTWTYVWQAGRQLRSMSKADGNDTITVEFEYDHAGLRTKKVKKVNNAVTEVTEYILNGKNVVELIHTAYPENSDPVVNVLHFYYDAQGRVAMVKYNTVMYGYVHDLQGDVIGILDNTGSVAVEYKYDAWGRPLGVTGTLAASLGELNPFRYRGYVFDEETGLYYLRSRYYNTYRSLFTNPDKEAVLITGNKLLRRNSFLYGNNNPINMIDQNGDDAIWIQERNSAMTFGHSGLMAQNAEGDWYYFFWGPQSEDISKEVVLAGTPNGSFIQNISIEENDITNTDTLKKVLENAGEDAAKRADLITDTYYFKGDYTATYEKANQFVQSGDKYSVLRNNCVQKTYEAFLASDSRFLWVSFKNLDSMVPNRIADQVSMIPSQKSKTPWKLILLNLLS